MGEKTQTAERRELYKIGEYPHNLLAVMEDQYGDPRLFFYVKLPEEVTQDVLDGLQYVLEKLPQRSQEVMYQRYQLKKTRSEIAKLFGVTPKAVEYAERWTLRKMYEPQNWNCIRYGLEGYRKIIQERQERIANTPITEFPISYLALSSRAYFGLTAANCKLIKDVVALTEAEIMAVNGFGPKSRANVAAALQKHGIVGTVWDKYRA